MHVCVVSQSLEPSWLMAVAFIAPHLRADAKEVGQDLPTASHWKEASQFLPVSVPPRKPGQESLRPHPRP